MVGALLSINDQGVTIYNKYQFPLLTTAALTSLPACLLHLACVHYMWLIAYLCLTGVAPLFKNSVIRS